MRWKLWFPVDFMVSTCTTWSVLFMAGVCVLTMFRVEEKSL